MLQFYRLGECGKASVPNYTLLHCTAEQLLNASTDGDALIYEDDVPTLVAGGSLLNKHHAVSQSQAAAIMRTIIEDDLICAALRDGLQRSSLNPHGNMPVDGAHPVDPAVELIRERAIRPVLGESLPGSTMTARFVRMAYDYYRART